MIRMFQPCRTVCGNLIWIFQQFCNRLEQNDFVASAISISLQKLNLDPLEVSTSLAQSNRDASAVSNSLQQLELDLLAVLNSFNSLQQLDPDL